LGTFVKTAEKTDAPTNSTAICSEHFLIEVIFGFRKKVIAAPFNYFNNESSKLLKKQSAFQIFVQYITAETIQNYGKSGTAAREDQRVSAMKFVLHSRLKIALSVNNLTFNQTVFI
jgi:hypothetical protein